MRPGAIVAPWLVAVACLTGCGGSGGGSQQPKAAVAKPPVAPCSLLTAREVSRVLDVHVRVKRAPSFCTYQGTRSHVFRAVVVTPQRLTVAVRPRSYQTRYGQIVEIAGAGYHGQAQNDQPAVGAAGLEQSKAQIVSGDVLVRLLVSYHGPGLRGVSQLHEVATLADHAGRRLARTR